MQKMVQEKTASTYGANIQQKITDSYKAQAVRQAGDAAAAANVKVIWVDASGQPTKDVPKFDNDLLNQLKQKGVIADDPNIPVDSSKLKLTSAVPIEQPKYPEPVSTGATSS